MSWIVQTMMTDRSHSRVAKTPACHAGSTGSIPVGTATREYHPAARMVVSNSTHGGSSPPAPAARLADESGCAFRGVRPSVSRVQLFRDRSSLGRALASHARGRGFDSLRFHGDVAQLGERLDGIQKATGSIPVISTRSSAIHVTRGCSSVGRALGLQPGCRRFEPGQLHMVKIVIRYAKLDRGYVRIRLSDGRIMHEHRFQKALGQKRFMCGRSCRMPKKLPA